MKAFSGGTCVTLEGRAEVKGVDLICIGYKYNKIKVLTFFLTRGASSTKEGKPYEARFLDKFGNVCVRHVDRPEIISNFFTYSNCVDVHNQVRQFDLALEKKWVTQNGYIRLFTTLVGIDVTDACKIRKIGDVNFPSIKIFADILARDMMNNANIFDCTVSDTSTVLETAVSSLTEDKIMVSEHTRVYLQRKKIALHVVYQGESYRNKKTMKCDECNAGFCQYSAGKSCWSHHFV